MVQETPERSSSGHQKRLSMSFIVSLMVMCARHASRVSKKLRAKPITHSHKQTQLEDFLKSPNVGRRGGGGGEGGPFGWSPARTPPRSPLRVRSKEMLMSLSNKAITLVSRKKTGYGGGAAAEMADETEEAEEEYGIWQRAILMGDKCQPLDFSGVIYYDCNGRQVKDVPLRSPRASPLPSFLTRGYVGSPLNPTGPKAMDD